MYGAFMLKQLRLVNFRSFKDFTVTFGDGAYLVGPNNAGKSTLLTALRVADVLLRYAYARKSDSRASDGDVLRYVYPVILRDFPALRDSLRFEFGTSESRLELTWKSGAKLVAVWPDEVEEDAASPFFYLLQADSSVCKLPKQARDNFPSLGIIPTLGPVEHTEKLLDDKYIKANIAGRLSSRHFRNQLRLLKDDALLESFWEWAAPWLGELTFDQMLNASSSEGVAIEAFFFERGSRVPKEVVWAGDGVQVWLQLLYHIHRVRDSGVIILDEPEVFLHPDLQRRLVQLLESTGRQVVLATHSTEMVTESDGRLTVLIDRSKKRAVRAKSDADYEMLTTALGTAFNLRLGRAMRSSVALFVEGYDMSVLRRFAQTLGLQRIAGEQGVTIIPLKGYSHWGQVEPFQWLLNELLPDAIRTFVILDRDYRTDQTCDEVEAQFASVAINAHVWKRKELESYLLNPEVIARVSGAPREQVAEWLGVLAGDQENDVFSRMLDDKMRAEKDAKNHSVNITTAFKPQFEQLWAVEANRLALCPPKQLISGLNGKLQGNGFRATSIVALARAHRVSEVPKEVSDLLVAIETAVS
jgi:energy-coupling factor transporter ATP-binding protein EcfA2